MKINTEISFIVPRFKYNKVVAFSVYLFGFSSYLRKLKCFVEYSKTTKHTVKLTSNKRGKKENYKALKI